MKIPKQQYTTEFKELAVKRVRDGQSAGAVAQELGLIEQTLRNWIKAAEVGISKRLMSKWPHRSRWNFQDCEPRACD